MKICFPRVPTTTQMGFWLASRGRQQTRSHWAMTNTGAEKVRDTRIAGVRSAVSPWKQMAGIKHPLGKTVQAYYQVGETHFAVRSRYL